MLVVGDANGTPINDIGIVITSTTTLNGTYGDFSFINSRTSEMVIAQHSDTKLFLGVPPGDYSVEFSYDVTVSKTNFALTGSNSVVIDDNNKQTVMNVDMIYVFPFKVGAENAYLLWSSVHQLYLNRYKYDGSGGQNDQTFMLSKADEFCNDLLKFYNIDEPLDNVFNIQLNDGVEIRFKPRYGEYPIPFGTKIATVGIENTNSMGEHEYSFIVLTVGDEW